MTTNSPSHVPTPHLQHTFVQNAQVCITYICDVPLLSHISMLSAQTLDGRDHELWSNERLPGIDSTGPYQPYPAVNHANALSPTRYTNAMRNEDQPHVGDVAIVSVHSLPSCSRGLC
jgi:hypothetical protein